MGGLCVGRIVAPEEALTFDSLSQLVQAERNRPALVRLRPRYYEELSRFVATLHSSLVEAHASGPAAQRSMLIGDELRKARVLVEELYSIRLRKVLILAHSAHTGVSVDTRPLTPPEIEVYESVVTNLAGARTLLLGAAEGVAPAATVRPKTANPATAAAPAGTASARPGSGTHPVRKADGAKPLVVIEAIEEIGEIMVAEGEVVNLKRQDVAHLPE